MKAARGEAGDAMKDQAPGSTASRRSNRARSMIVVAELVLSLMLLTAGRACSIEFSARAQHRP